MHLSIFRSAVTGADGTVDPGYFALYWVVAVTVGVIPVLVLIAAYAVFHFPGPAEVLQNTGIAIGAICTGAAAVIAAVGAFRMGDKSKEAK